MKKGLNDILKDRRPFVPTYNKKKIKLGFKYFNYSLTNTVVWVEFPKGNGGVYIASDVSSSLSGSSMLSLSLMLPTGINGRYMSSTSKRWKHMHDNYTCISQLYLYLLAVVADALVEGPAPPEVDAFNVQL